jgi:hypothetical protein
MKLSFIKKYRNSFFTSFIFACFLTACSSTWAQCGVSYSCAVPICTGACYASDAAKKKAEADGKCRAESKCEAAARSVKEVLDKTPKTDPTYGFYRNQNCIASQSCASTAELDSSKWINNVVSDFIRPLVDETGDWKAKKKECAEMFPPLGKGLRCQNLMADYHINYDLKNSISKNGCGTEKDWDKVGDWLKTCVKKGIDEDVPYGLRSIAEDEANNILAYERSKLRTACIADRNKRGLKIEE